MSDDTKMGHPDFWRNAHADAERLLAEHDRREEDAERVQRLAELAENSPVLRQVLRRYGWPESSDRLIVQRDEVLEAAIAALVAENDRLAEARPGNQQQCEDGR